MHCELCTCHGDGKTGTNCLVQCVANNHFDCLKVGCKCACTLNWDVPAEAAKTNNVPILTWCFENGKKINLNTVLVAVENNSQECLEYICNEGTVPWYKNIVVINKAISCNNIDAMTFLLSKNIDITDAHIHYCVESNSLEMFKLILSNVKNPNMLYNLIARKTNNKDMMKHAIDTISTVPTKSTLIMALEYNNIEIATYLHSLELKDTNDIFRIKSCISLESVQKAVEYEIPIDEYWLFNCIEMAQLDIIKYLNEQNVPKNISGIEKHIIDLLESMRDNHRDLYEYYYTNVI